MNELIIIAPNEEGVITKVVINYGGKPGDMMKGLAQHFCYPAEVDGQPNLLTPFEYVARRVAGDLIGLAVQEQERAALEVAQAAVKEARPSFTVATAAE